jgi:hypothetical protein
MTQKLIPPQTVNDQCSQHTQDISRITGSLTGHLSVLSPTNLPVNTDNIIIGMRFYKELYYSLSNVFYIFMASTVAGYFSGFDDTGHVPYLSFTTSSYYIVVLISSGYIIQYKSYRYAYRG